MLMTTVIVGVISIIVLINFISPLQTSITDANQTGTVGTILDQMPLLLAVGLLFIGVACFLYYSKR